MNFKKIFILLTTLLVSSFGFAQTITPEYDATKKTISIVVNTDFECWGVGFKFNLPEGVTVPLYENDDEEMVPNIVKGSRAKSSSTLDIQKTPTGDYSLNLYGAALKKDATAPVIVITLDGEMKGNIKFYDIAFTDEPATSYEQDAFDFALAAPVTELGSIEMVIESKVSEPYNEQQKDIPAAGGKDRAAAQVDFYVVRRTFMSDGTYTDGDKSDVVTAYIYGEETAEIPSLGTTVKERTKVGTSTAKGKLYYGGDQTYKAETTDYAKVEDFEATAAALDIYQEANVATYGDVTISTIKTCDFGEEADSYDLANSSAAAQFITYTSGASKDAQVTISYEVKTAVEGYSLNGSVVSVTKNEGEARNGFVVTATATGEGGKTITDDITFSQAKSTSISSLNATMTDSKIYDLNGRAINTTAGKLAKGVYIINNRKYIVK